jgi:NADPH:quinone reductase-like Zn-dependent oxidoreductase
MKAIQLIDYGGVDKLKLAEVPSPKPGPGEVRVKVIATSVNPVDYKIRSGAAKAMFPQQFPAILGRDLSGEVVEVGAGVTQFKPGDKVLGLVQRSYAEELVANADHLTRLPAGLDAQEAGALPLVVTTGAQLIEHTGVQRGQTVLVTGALGGVGRSAVHAAKQRGASVIAGVRKKDLDQAKTLRADRVAAIDEGAADLPQLDAIADTVGGETIQKLMNHLKPGGTIGSVLGDPKGAKERGFKVSSFMAVPNAPQLREMAEAVVRGELTIPIAKRFSLAQAPEAQRAAEAGLAGKALITP